MSGIRPGYTADRARSSGVTAREAEVLRLLAARYGNAEIAAKLWISKRTVESHVSALRRKLHAADRVTLIRVGAELADPGCRTGGSSAASPGARENHLLRRRAANAGAAASDLCTRAARTQRTSLQLLAGGRNRH